MISRLSIPVAIFAAALLGGCATKEVEKGAAYAVNLTGAAAELDHPNYDPELGGYWLVGASATMQFSLVHNRTIPESFSFVLRTKPDASLQHPSQLDRFTILSPTHIIISQFNDGPQVPVHIKTRGNVLVKSDTTGSYVKFERVAERIKVTLSKDCLRLIGQDAVITWIDKQTAPKAKPKDSEDWRRVL